MATITNQTRNTGTITNQEFSSVGLTWDEATFTWDEAAGTWQNPQDFTNQAQNTASLTNQSYSD